MTFDFTGQNVILPTDFAFAYRDNNPDGNVSPGYGFSVIYTASDDASVGSSQDGFLDAYPNDATSHTFQFGVNGEIPGDTASGNLLATITASEITAAPEPSTLSMAGIAGLMGMGYAWRRRKTASA